MDNQYRIGELAEKAGVTRRTIHYYLGRGLLPAPEGAGLGTTYTGEHLYRIMLIKKLQDGYLPLDEIKKRIVGMSLDEVKQALENNVGLVAEQVVEYRSERKLGTPYERISIGFGVEIHFSAGSEKAAVLAEKLFLYAETLMKEG